MAVLVADKKELVLLEQNSLLGKNTAIRFLRIRNSESSELTNTS